jgi:hypothetical protein
MIFIFMRNLIRRILREENENIPKSKMMKLIEKLGIVSAVKTIGMDDILDILDTTPIDLVSDYFINKQFSTKDFDINTGGYDFNFIITDIVDGAMDESWVVDVEIINGEVTLIMTDNETYDLWDSDLWEKDYWWEIQGEIDDIISDILKPYKPKDIDLEIMHNLR